MNFTSVLNLSGMCQKILEKNTDYSQRNTVRVYLWCFLDTPSAVSAAPPWIAGKRGSSWKPGVLLVPSLKHLCQSRACPAVWLRARFMYLLTLRWCGFHVGIMGKKSEFTKRRQAQPGVESAQSSPGRGDHLQAGVLQCLGLSTPLG